MNQSLSYIFGLFVLSYAFCFHWVTAQEIPEGYSLVWSDEFNEDGPPNPSNWIFEEGFVRNRELQWYQKDNAFVRDGRLIIEGRRESKPNPNYDPDSENWRTSREQINYTSSCIKTKGLRSFKYGVFEIRAKIITEEGLWPAIWTLGSEGRWPENGECDILEFYDGLILANFAWGSEERHQPIWDAQKIPLKNFDDPDFDRKFHTWRLVWTPEKMEIYLDGALLNEVELENTVNVRDGENPFQQPHYLLLNLAIGSNGGDPSETEFPTRYLVDYVRVYQKQ